MSFSSGVFWATGVLPATSDTARDGTEEKGEGRERSEATAEAASNGGGMMRGAPWF
jgi:hypothetical protein